MAQPRSSGTVETIVTVAFQERRVRADIVARQTPVIDWRTAMRSNFTVACALCALVLVGAVVSGADDKDKDKKDESRIKRGFEIAPVTLTFKKKDHDLVGLGSYIVNAQGACSDCHTCPTYAPGHNPYSGGDGQVDAAHYLAGGVPFGPFVSANLTPDAVTGVPDEGHSLQQFKSLMHTGRDPVDGDIIQVMPWPIYRFMTDDDLEAVYAYLKAIPHAEPGACGGPGE
jgi:hypothetical protein